MGKMIQQRDIAACVPGIPAGAKLVPFAQNWVFRMEGDGGRDMIRPISVNVGDPPAVLYVVLFDSTSKLHVSGPARTDDTPAMRDVLFRWRFLVKDGYAISTRFYQQDDGQYVRESTSMHRLAMGLPPKVRTVSRIYREVEAAEREDEEDDNKVVDHINQDRLDNRIANLRHVTYQINAINRKMSARNKTGVTGVHWSEARHSFIVTWVAYEINEKPGALQGQRGNRARAFAANQYGGDKCAAFLAACKWRDHIVHTLPHYALALDRPVTDSPQQGRVEGRDSSAPGRE